MTGLARELRRPAAAWQRRTGVVIVGSGAAGLSAALHLAYAGVPAVLLTRAEITDSATDWAQGGLAAAWSPQDSVEAHVADTLAAGAGLNRPDAVRELVEQAPAAISRLIALGAGFDTDEHGDYDLHLEGGHHARRILHAGGDASGHEVVVTLADALMASVRKSSSVRVVTGQRAVDVLTDRRGRACGVRVQEPDGTIGEWRAPAVVLASGGIGQAWPLTTNPAVATGDGVAMALRAGAELRDMEFVQFHPTILAVPNPSRRPGDRGVLVSEAVRGEGATLIDHEGVRIMEGVHPLGDLAPRDVVSAAIEAHLTRTGEPHVFLDATGFGERTWAKSFPTILRLCRERGVDPVNEPIPVHPAAHYLCGGVAADLDGVTSVPALYAVGEVAATGVQGANRLASNSVTEALVAGDRVGALLSAAELPRVGEPVTRTGVPARGEVAMIRRVMHDAVGVVRTEGGLRDALRTLGGLPLTGDLDAANLHAVATAVATAALGRTESRGCHRRADHPGACDAWIRHQSLALDDRGELVLGTQPLRTDAEREAA